MLNNILVMDDINILIMDDTDIPIDKKQDDFDVLIYHGGCLDGLLSAYTYWTTLPKDTRDKLVELKGVPTGNGTFRPDFRKLIKAKLPLFIYAKHGKDPLFNWLKGKRVVIVDFSYPYEQMVKIAQLAKFVTVLDHHNTAEKNLAPFLIPPSRRSATVPKNVKCVFDQTLSGAELAWKERFQPNIKLPKLYTIITDQDLWRWTYPDSKECACVLRVEKTLESFPAIEKIIWGDSQEKEIQAAARTRRVICKSKFYDDLVKKGKVYSSYETKIVNRLAGAAKIAYATEKNSNPEKIYNVLVVNSPIFQSEIGNYLCCNNIIDFVAVWFYSHAQQRIFVSLRTSRDDIDLSVLTPNLKGINFGGGHPQAAGGTICGSDITVVFSTHRE